jgi:hypothetical protein
MRFNMGCGRKRLAGYRNVDAWAGCEPDEVWDLERTPWPWAEDCAEEVLFNHSLEHMGGDPGVFLAIVSELYRICRPDAVVKIAVPHPRHDNFISDPTHVRPITADTLKLFDRRLNEQWDALGGSNSLLARRLEVDFEVLSTEVVIAEPFYGRLSRGELSQAEVMEMLQHQLNIARELRFELRVCKPARTGAA